MHSYNSNKWPTCSRWTKCLLLILSIHVVFIECKLEADLNSDDYYKILGVEKTSSQEDIRRAFRRLAKTYHPDISKEDNAEEKFKKINTAAETLSDPNKRREYDYRNEGGRSTTRFGSNSFDFGSFDFDFSDIFSELHTRQKQNNRRSTFGDDNSHFRMFNNFANMFGDDDDDHFGSGDSFFGQHFGGGSNYNSKYVKSSDGRKCETVTKRVGNTVTTYTTCS